MTTLSAVSQLAPASRASVARLVQIHIHGLEQTIDHALSGGGSLLTRMVDAGQAAKLSAGEGQAAIDRVVASIDAARTMRAEIVAAHDELRTIGGRINLREMGWGDLVPSPASAAAASGVAGVGELAA